MICFAYIYISILHYITSPSPDFVETPIESWFSDVPIWGAVVAGMRASTPVSLSWLMLMLLTLLPWPAFIGFMGH